MKPNDSIIHYLVGEILKYRYILAPRRCGKSEAAKFAALNHNFRVVAVTQNAAVLLSGQGLNINSVDSMYEIRKNLEAYLNVKLVFDEFEFNKKKDQFSVLSYVEVAHPPWAFISTPHNDTYEILKNNELSMKNFKSIDIINAARRIKLLEKLSTL